MKRALILYALIHSPEYKRSQFLVFYYSGRTNSVSQADYTGRGVAPVPPYKPVPPPKPKHYRPPTSDNGLHPRNGVSKIIGKYKTR